MFHSARVKLTMWYVVIVMIVGLLFSMMIYEALSREVERFEQAQRVRIGWETYEATPHPELVEEAKRRIISALIIINGGVLIVSGGVAYFLAGRTLRPIQDMVDEQHRFITDASHQLRTPLTSLKSALEVNLRDKNLTLKEAKILMKQNIDDVNRLQVLSESLLRLTQHQNGNNGIHLERTNVGNVIKEAIKKVEALAIQKNIAVKNTVGKHMIMGNHFELVELFVILLDNAIKYSPGGKIISIRAKQENPYISIYVKDNGSGIDKKDLPKIFDRFYRGTNSAEKRTIFGYGLGLSIAKRIIDTHKGEIAIKSSIKHGTEVQLTFRQVI